MIVTSTAVSFIVLSFGLALFGWRFLKASGRDTGSVGDKKSRLLLPFFFLGFGVQNAILGFGTLFFGQNPEGMFGVVLVANSFLTLVAIFGIYVAYYIFAPQASPVPLMGVTFMIGIAAVVLAVISHPLPFITQEGGIDWNMTLPVSLVTFQLLLIGIGMQLYIFMRLFFQTTVKEIKILSLLLAFAALLGVLDNFVRFVLLHNIAADARTRIYDIGTGITAVGLLVAFGIVAFMKKRSGRQDYNRKGSFKKSGQ